MYDTKSGYKIYWNKNKIYNTDCKKFLLAGSIDVLVFSWGNNNPYPWWLHTEINSTVENKTLYFICIGGDRFKKKCWFCFR